MELTIHEASALLGKSPRTVRAQVAQGVIPGTKRNGTWRIASEMLPLTEVQRRSLLRRAQEARDAVERALPARLRGETPRVRSVRDFEPFARLADVLGATDPARSAWHERARRVIARAMRELAAACHEFAAERRAPMLRRARTRLAGLVATGHSAAAGDADALAVVDRIEREVLPPIGGLLRWLESRARRGRREP
jgi:hypothetical protein